MASSCGGVWKLLVPCVLSGRALRRSPGAAPGGWPRSRSSPGRRHRRHDPGRPVDAEADRRRHRSRAATVGRAEHAERLRLLRLRDPVRAPPAPRARGPPGPPPRPARSPSSSPSTRPVARPNRVHDDQAVQGVRPKSRAAAGRCVARRRSARAASTPSRPSRGQHMHTRLGRVDLSCERRSRYSSRACRMCRRRRRASTPKLGVEAQRRRAGGGVAVGQARDDPDARRRCCRGGRRGPAGTGPAGRHHRRTGTRRPPGRRRWCSRGLVRRRRCRRRPPTATSTVEFRRPTARSKAVSSSSLAPVGVAVEGDVRTAVEGDAADRPRARSVPHGARHRRSGHRSTRPSRSRRAAARPRRRDRRRQAFASAPT